MATDNINALFLHGVPKLLPYVSVVTCGLQPMYEKLVLFSGSHEELPYNRLHYRLLEGTYKKAGGTATDSSPSSDC